MTTFKTAGTGSISISGQNLADKLNIPDWMKEPIKQALSYVSIEGSIESSYIDSFSSGTLQPFNDYTAFLPEINIDII